MIRKLLIDGGFTRYCISILYAFRITNQPHHKQRTDQNMTGSIQ